MPSVSVIIPVYNVESYLGECLDSVLRQTLRDIEIICVDDGSTDGSPKILSEYAARDSRIKIITQPNAGLGAARNSGMDVATGKYLYFLDSDDWIIDNALETCFGICERDDLDQVVFGCEVQATADASHGVDEAVVRLKGAYYRIDETMCGRVAEGTSLLSELLSRRRFFASVPLRFMRRDAIRASSLRFPEKLIHEDEYFTPLSLILSRRAEIVGEKLYCRRLRQDSIETSVSLDGKTEARHLAHLMVVTLLLCDRLDKTVSGKKCRDVADAVRRYLVRSCVRRSLTSRNVLSDARHLAVGLVAPAERGALTAFCRHVRLAAVGEKVKRCFIRLRRGVVARLRKGRKS